MNIAVVSPDHLRDWHGTTRLIDRIAREMTRRGHSIIMIANEGRASKKVPVSPLDYPHTLIAADLASPAGRAQARERIAAANPDICLASVGNDMIMMMPQLLKGTNIPFVYGDPHDVRVRTYAAWQPYESFGALNTADAIQTLLPEYIPFYPAPLRGRVTEIGIPAPPPADVDFAARRRKKERIILCVGRFNETMKRFSLALRAFALLYKDFPDWRLKLVGDGPYFEYYRVMAEQLGISKLVTFTGAVLDTGAHYETADIFCSSSLLEGFALVFPEAAARALPLVGYDFCVCAASVIKSDMGALAKTGANGAMPEDLAAALRSLMALSPEERETIGKRARDVVQERYNGNKLFDKWENLLTETIKKARDEGKTALTKVCGMEQTGTLKFIGDEWNGLTPDAPVWTHELLDAAAKEITDREDPYTPPEQSDLPADAENVRLRCEIIKLKEDYRKLENKYRAAAAQLQAGQRRRGGK